MNYVFCGAYKGVLFGLYLKHIGEEITIVTYNEDIIEYCIAENINYIQFKLFRLKVTSIYKIFSLKKILNETIDKIDLGKKDRYFLLGISKGYDYFYLAKELSKSGGVGYYKLPDGRHKIYKSPRFKPIFFRGALIKFVLKLVLDLDLMYYRQDERTPCLGIDDRFLEKYNIKEYAADVNVEKLILDVVRKSKSKYKEFDNLFVDQGPLSNVIEFNSFKNLIEKMLDLSIDIALKKHPKPAQKKNKSKAFFYDLFKNCEEIPRYIPIEFFCNNIRKNVISVYSTSLITAAQLPHLKAISLIELLDWYDDKYKKEWKERLSKASNNKILFPKNFDELKGILLSK